jgi:hypothetical protein
VTSKQINLPENKQIVLRRWLDDSAFNLLMEVIESVAFENEVKAANSLLYSTSGMDSEAKEFVRVANLHYEMISTLTKLRENKDPFTISSAKPSPKDKSSTK